jgi:hypothetical protein
LQKFINHVFSQPKKHRLNYSWLSSNAGFGDFNISPPLLRTRGRKNGGQQRKRSHEEMAAAACAAAAAIDALMPRKRRNRRPPAALMDGSLTVELPVGMRSSAVTSVSASRMTSGITSGITSGVTTSNSNSRASTPEQNEKPAAGQMEVRIKCFHNF